MSLMFAILIQTSAPATAPYFTIEHLAAAHIAEILGFVWWAGGLAENVKWLKSEMERLRDLRDRENEQANNNNYRGGGGSVHPS